VSALFGGGAVHVAGGRRLGRAKVSGQVAHKVHSAFPVHQAQRLGALGPVRSSGTRWFRVAAQSLVLGLPHCKFLLDGPRHDAAAILLHHVGGQHVLRGLVVAPNRRGKVRKALVTERQGQIGAMSTLNTNLIDTNGLVAATNVASHVILTGLEHENLMAQQGLEWRQLALIRGHGQGHG
jgi:hypothetical protein